MKPLTPKQQRFVDEYLVDLNATAAARRAGYSTKTADRIGPELLGKTSVAAAIAAGQAKRSQRTGITQDYVLSTIVDTVERCRQAAPVLDRKGEQIWVETPDGQILPAYAFDAKAVLRGCELLGKHIGIFTEKVSLTGPGGGPLQVLGGSLPSNVAAALSERLKRVGVDKG